MKKFWHRLNRIHPALRGEMGTLLGVAQTHALLYLPPPPGRRASTLRGPAAREHEPEGIAGVPIGFGTNAIILNR